MSKKRSEASVDDEFGVKRRRMSKFGVLAEFDEGNEDCSAEIGQAVLDVTEAEKTEKSREKIEKISRRRAKVFGAPSIGIKRAELHLDDIAHLAHSFLIPAEIPKPGWFRPGNFKKPSHLVLARINCDERLICDENKKMAFLREFFGNPFVPVEQSVCETMDFWKRLTEISLPRMSHIKALLKKNKNLLAPGMDTELKLQFLTSVEQMMYFNYPLAGFTEEIEGIASIVNSKAHYGKLTKNSPIFVVDCEMCQTTANKAELTRITMIDEQGNIVIDSFVKPKNPITDYVTCFSGVTKESLEGVTVTVEDVQQALRRVLPPDAILAGHSIENDLMAMRVSHPYCIDVGLIYSMRMNRNNRQSLRKLTSYYLREDIQSSENGHCSYEDCWATLELLKLKLEHGPTFGSVPDGFDYVKWSETLDNSKDKKELDKEIKENKKTYVKDVKLPPPRCVGYCEACNTEIKSQCCVEDCLCMKHQPKKCIMCVGRDEEYPDPPEHERFNYGHAVKKYVEKSKTSLKDASELFPLRKALFARYLNTLEEHVKVQNLTVIDITNHKTPTEIKNNVLDANVIESDMCVIEYNAEENTEEEVDGLVKYIHSSMAPLGVFALLMCTSARAIMYFGVKV
ncbi:unnamed protein product [Bursaphelenchus xylophilus]|uniref:(pine wood nematode) hypothetical protein n=1 Tax=Bursaphelenchus xylophilus TaxID=6326 RepID=A0A1I7S5I5_BURXY|nr:unnamed protein product [Bursaphelenchus xylophilus]CAG9124745.1 unnamed protein product [Bursaphelenchus xylophilus]